MRNDEFDPLAYIENAFLDRNPRSSSNVTTEKVTSAGSGSNSEPKSSNLSSTAQSSTALSATATATRTLESPTVQELQLPELADYLPKSASEETVLDPDDAKARRRFRKTEMRAPRPRRTSTDDQKPQIDPHLQSVWEALPRNIDFLISFFDDSVTANYYGGEFKESREDLIRRLLDPELTLEETSRLLGVCPATVRRYTNRGWLSHHRTTGGQRRFRLSDLVRFVEVHGRFPED